MSHQKAPNILIEKIRLERMADFHEAVIESGPEWLAEEMIPRPDLSREELEAGLKNLLERWEKDEFYVFFIMDGSTNRLLGFAFLNHVNRQYEMANLGYAVRTSCVGQGIATEAARLLARYGFEKLLSFQKIMFQS